MFLANVELITSIFTVVNQILTERATHVTFRRRYRTQFHTDILLSTKVRIELSDRNYALVSWMIKSSQNLLYKPEWYPSYSINPIDYFPWSWLTVARAQCEELKLGITHWEEKLSTVATYEEWKDISEKLDEMKGRYSFSLSLSLSRQQRMEGRRQQWILRFTTHQRATGTIEVCYSDCYVWTEW
jgi:hypothetical protein